MGQPAYSVRNKQMKVEFRLVLVGISSTIVYFLLDVSRGTCLIRRQQATLSFSVRAISPRNARSVAGCRARGHRSFVCANHDTTKDDIGNINNINSTVPHQPTKLDHRVRNDGVGMSENPAPDNSAENACDNTMDLGSRDV